MTIGPPNSPPLSAFTRHPSLSREGSTEGALPLNRIALLQPESFSVSAFRRCPSSHSRNGSGSFSDAEISTQRLGKGREFPKSFMISALPKTNQPAQLQKVPPQTSSLADLETFDNEFELLTREKIRCAKSTTKNLEEELRTLSSEVSRLFSLDKGSPPPVPLFDEEVSPSQRNGTSSETLESRDTTSTDRVTEGISPLNDATPPGRLTSQPEGNSPFNHFGPPPEAMIFDEDEDVGAFPNDYPGAPPAESGEETACFYTPEELTPWKRYKRAQSVSPRSKREVPVRMDQLPPTTPFPGSKPASSSKSQTPACDSSPLPIATTDSQGNKERWFRKSDRLLPGIIIDSHQGKHVDGALFGTYRGRRGDSFNREDCTEERLKSIFEELLQFDELDFLNFPPQSNIDSPSIVSLTNSRNKKIPYDRVVISSIAFSPERNAWCLHFYPDHHPRQ